MPTLRSDDIYIQCDKCVRITHFVSEELLNLRKNERKKDYESKDYEEEELHSI